VHGNLNFGVINSFIPFATPVIQVRVSTLKGAMLLTVSWLPF